MSRWEQLYREDKRIPETVHSQAAERAADHFLRRGQVQRVLRPGGLVVLAVLAGDPTAGLPHVHLFSEAELMSAVRGFVPQARDCYADHGCTGREDYRVWYVVLRR